MTKPEKPYWSDESGATMVEYALMIAFIAVVCFVFVQFFGNAVTGLFNTAVAAIAAAL